MLLSFDVNPLTNVWHVLDGNNSLTLNFGEFIKLAELVVVHVLGSIEDEHLFSSVGFLNSKLCNHLEENIQVVLGMFAPKIYTLESFPY